MTRSLPIIPSGAMIVLGYVIFLLQELVMVEAQFGRRRRREARLLAERFSAEQKAIEEMCAKWFSFCGVNKFHVIAACTVIVAMIVRVLLSTNSPPKRFRGNRPDKYGTLDVVVVGCGLPKKGMGWYHLTQLMEMENVNVRAVIEPFFMNNNLCPHPPHSFTELVRKLERQGVPCYASIDSVKGENGEDTFERPTMSLIAGRTSDNPILFRECVQKGSKLIYLEKPGAPTFKDLQEMRSLALLKGISVYLGYNKNVTPYVQKALDLANRIEHAHIFFCHNNSYTEEDLPEVFARNSEGMMKNMAVHELALLVTYFGVTVNTIQEFKVNKSRLFSEKLRIRIPDSPNTNPQYISDFSRIAFKITTKAGKTVSVMADRCGGNVSYAIVKDETGKEVNKFEFPDPKFAAKVEQLSSADPEMMPYFFVQSDDYLELKRRIVNSYLKGINAPGIATIDVAIEALKLAEYGTEAINNALESS